MTKKSNKVKRAFSILKREGFGGLKTAIARKALASQEGTGLWQAYQAEAFALAENFDFSSEDLAASQRIQAEHQAETSIKSITWFIPDFQHAYYGGMHTILRFADFMAREQQVKNQFALAGSYDAKVISHKIGEAFPALNDATVFKLEPNDDMTNLPPSDASIATLWSTAYPALKFNQVKRKFYFIQDFEPLFYPAGSTQAQVEATYAFGFDGICNTPILAHIYQSQYAGRAFSFLPSVDGQVFHMEGRQPHSPSQPWRVFFYARPGHPRNGFELGMAALKKLKHRLGDRVEIVCAGDGWDPQSYSLQGVVQNLGILPYAETGALYRTCDAGLVMMFTRHPSYLPFELMACGCCVVSNRNPHTQWFLHDGENCLLADASATNLADQLEEALLNASLRSAIIARASQDITRHYSNWQAEFEKVFAWMGADRSI